MKRRELLRLLGAAAAATGLSPAQLAAVTRAGARRPRRAFFTDHQRETVATIAEAIIPATDTPGARDAGVAEFIEAIVSEWYRPGERGRFMRGLADVDARARAIANTPFALAAADRRIAILTGLEAEGDALRAGDDDAPTPFFHRIRGLVLHGYYTSEVGMTQELRYRPLPGRYEGCVDLTDVARPVPGGP